ncbi:hypothetical protein CLOM_g22677 [Closterium sp. NIES-68]|nr:hypothetical protein CLOM_g22677 [Closterium sp. NIES-68]
MRALVLNAGKLDEAALALSTEPLVRAYMMPQVKAMLTPDPWRMLRPFPAKTWPVTLANLYNNCWVVLWAVVLAVPYALLWLLNFLLVPYFSNQLLRLFITLGFGLQKNELGLRAGVRGGWLRLPPATHSITHWNVQKILTAGHTRPAQGPSKTIHHPRRGGGDGGGADGGAVAGGGPPRHRHALALPLG